MHLSSHGPVFFFCEFSQCFSQLFKCFILLDLPITALRKSGTLVLYKSQILCPFSLADCLCLFSLVEMKINGIPRCLGRRGAVDLPSIAAAFRLSETSPREGCFCGSSPLQKLQAYYFGLLQKRRLSANQDTALILAHFQPNDSFVE